MVNANGSSVTWNRDRAYRSIRICRYNGARFAPDPPFPPAVDSHGSLPSGCIQGRKSAAEGPVELKTGHRRYVKKS
jgi:hypothetical protein